MPAADATVGDDLALLRDAGREAGTIALRYFKQNPEVWLKAGTSPVSEADYAVDRFLRETLLSARPDYGWLSEETTDDHARLEARRTFVVDPIDGTRGFLEGRAEWCVALAVVEAGKPLAGVLDCPASGEVFWSSPGGGAFKNGRRLMVRQLGPHPEIAGPKPFFDAMPPDLASRARRFHYVPSLAYRLAMIADARLDATFVKPNAHDWDLAAADLILSEAGGKVLDDHGRAPSYAGAEIKHGALVAGHPDVVAAVAGVIAERG